MARRVRKHASLHAGLPPCPSCMFACNWPACMLLHRLRARWTHVQDHSATSLTAALSLCCSVHTACGSGFRAAQAACGACGRHKGENSRPAICGCMRFTAPLIISCLVKPALGRGRSIYDGRSSASICYCCAADIPYIRIHHSLASHQAHTAQQHTAQHALTAAPFVDATPGQGLHMCNGGVGAAGCRLPHRPLHLATPRRRARAHPDRWVRAQLATCMMSTCSCLLYRWTAGARDAYGDELRLLQEGKC